MEYWLLISLAAYCVFSGADHKCFLNWKTMGRNSRYAKGAEKVVTHCTKNWAYELQWN